MCRIMTLYRRGETVSRLGSAHRGVTHEFLCVVWLLALLAVCSAQSYRSDWRVVGSGGGEMASSTFRCGATAGQTAAGLITGPNFWALIGFWLPEGQAGVREAAQWLSGHVAETRLYAPQPNPAKTQAAIRYSLAFPVHAYLSIHDLTGREVRVLADAQQKAGRYSITWNGTDGRGRDLANGVYFCRFAAGETRVTDKLILAR